MSCLDPSLSPASPWAHSDPPCLPWQFPRCQELRSTVSERWEQQCFPTPCLSPAAVAQEKGMSLSITRTPFTTETTLSRDCSCLTREECGFLPIYFGGGLFTYNHCLGFSSLLIPVFWRSSNWTQHLIQPYKRFAEGNKSSPLLLSPGCNLGRRNHLWKRKTCSSRISRILFGSSKNWSEAGRPPPITVLRGVVYPKESQSWQSLQKPGQQLHERVFLWTSNPWEHGLEEGLRSWQRCIWVLSLW